jgi:hypothetical protein
MQKSYPCYLAQVTSDFRSGPETSSTMLTQHGHELAIQLFKNFIKTQTNLENHETCPRVMISYVESVVKKLECLEKVVRHYV